MKCMVKNCQNRDEQGHGIWVQNLTVDQGSVFWVCMPCFSTFKGESVNLNSQLSRNVQEAKEAKEGFMKEKKNEKN